MQIVYGCFVALTISKVDIDLAKNRMIEVEDGGSLPRQLLLIEDVGAPALDSGGLPGTL